MTVRLSARSRLTLLYTTMFGACGAVLIAVTYALLAHNLGDTNGSAGTTPRTETQDEQNVVAKCVAVTVEKSAVTKADAQARCISLYAKGVAQGARAQRDAALHNLLLYSLLALAGVTVLAAVAGWFAAGRILRPVHQLTAAARRASEGNLTHRLELTGPRDELRELADTFDDMLGRLDAAFTTQRQFIANAGHELRTPLTVMRTTLDVVLAKPRPTSAELLAMTEDVRTAVDQAERLIDALLTLARSQYTPLAGDCLDLATVAEDALDMQQLQGLTVTTELRSAPVVGDPVLLERLIGNLLDNAARYNSAAGTIEISTGTTDRTSVIRVVNTGPIVSPADLDRLFRPFARAQDRVQHDGFGLGLAIVHSIASSSNAVVDARVVPTGGLDIMVEFPAAGREA